MPSGPSPRQPLLLIAAFLIPAIGVLFLSVARLAHNASTTQPAQGSATTAPAVYSRLVGTPGYWRLARSPTGVWWFLSPDNRREFLNSVTTVWPYQKPFRDGESGFVSRDYDGGYRDTGDVRRWATATASRVREAGFKSLGAWCHPAFHDVDIPMTRDLNLWKFVEGKMGERARIYDPGFFDAIESAVRLQVPPLKENRALVGYYTDNELDWGDDHLGPWRYFDGLPPADPNRQVVCRLARDIWKTPAAFNAEWGTTLADWNALDSLDHLPRDKPRAYIRLQSALLYDIARTYYTRTSALVRQYDPNHLVLGVRFKGYAVPEVLAAAKGLTDAQSLNYYVSDALLDEQMIRDALSLAAQPLIISEYSFHSLDNRSRCPNKVGFAGQVTDQKARADAYRLMTERLARVPWVIGADWFQWNDEPATGRIGDGEDVNFGVVDTADQPYEQLTQSIRQTSARLNDIHAASDPARLEDVFRSLPSPRPVFVAPYLSNRPELGGPLTAWPAAARLPDIRHALTVGLERSSVPLPTVYLGWREEGLYLAIEAFDSTPEGVSATGNWWTRDCIEWWLATTPPAEGQHFYDATCRQFFFTPDALSAGTPDRIGTVGLWHRSGDGLPGPMVPADVTSVSRKSGDRYRVDVFIPAALLNGYMPAVGAELAFNFQAHNFHEGLDYYWSAGKDSLTHLRPSTWGRLVLGQSPR